MTLVDTGPLVALINTGDTHHVACTKALSNLPDEPLVTTWSCFTEAMYLLDKEGGYLFTNELWGFVEAGDLHIRTGSPEETARMRALMHRYRDTPMDLADASLVAAAEALSVHRVFTVDSHFYAYRTASSSTLGLIQE